MAAAAILRFKIFKFSNCPNGQAGGTALLCQICRNCSNRGRDMAIFRLLKMAAAAILDFWNYKSLTVGRVKSVELRHRAKLRGDRLNRCQDITIFGFFKMATAVTLDFKNFKFLTVEMVKNVIKVLCGTRTWLYLYMRCIRHWRYSSQRACVCECRKLQGAAYVHRPTDDAVAETTVEPKHGVHCQCIHDVR